MALKRPNHLDEPPSASSDEYDEEEDESEQEQSHAQPNQPNKSHSRHQQQEEQSDEEEASEEEEEEETPSNTPPVTKNPIPTPTPTQKPKSSSESESNEGSDSEPESNKTQQSPTASQFTIKPHVLPSKRPTVLSLPSKRPHEENSVVESHKNKNKLEKEEENKSGEEKKGHVISRLWSEEDEITILKGMIDYKAKKGTDPYGDMTLFHDFIKGSLRVDVTRTQLTDKIYRLKKKYQNNAKKGGNGEDPVFSKPHEHKSFELSKNIWGGGGISNVKDENVKSNNKSKDRKSGKVNDIVESSKEDRKEIVVREVVKSEVNGEKDDFRSKYPRLSESLELEKSSYLSLPEGVKNFVREKISLVGSVKAKELEERWKNLRLKECELYTKRIELIQEQSKLVLDAIKSSDS